MLIKSGTLLYRGIDSYPATNPLRLNNGEKILWCAGDSGTAQTYIPDWGGLAGFPIPWAADDTPRPDDGIITGLMEELGGPITIHRREWEFNPKYHSETPPERIANGTVGRPVSWSQPNRVTYQTILAHLETLGYKIQGEHYLWLKTKANGWTKIAPADSRLTGTLVIFEALQDLQGKNCCQGDLMDPDYHHAAQWGKNTPSADFLQINDYCQTKKWGNVGHTAFAILQPGLDKLRILAEIPAHHFEWGQDPHPNTNPSPEEILWRTNQEQNYDTRPHALAGNH